MTRRARAGRADPAAVHAGRRQPVRRRPARRLRQGPRPQLLPHLRPATSCRTTSATTSAPSSPASSSTRYVVARAAAADAAVSPRRGARSARRPRTSTQPVGDGLPETLAEWIRVRRPDAPEDQAQRRRPRLGRGARRRRRARRATERRRSAACATWYYSLDFNERCPNVGYLLDFLRAGEGADARAAFERIQYIEQPTARDLKANRAQRHARGVEAAAGGHRRIADRPGEPAAGAARWATPGAALKACKGQTQSLLLAAAAQKYGMFLCVQDLTCPGASLIHSAGLAAHVPGSWRSSRTPASTARRRTSRGRPLSRACSASPTARWRRAC